MRKSRSILKWWGVIGLVVIMVMTVAGCTATTTEEGTAEGTATAATETCSECHNDTTLVYSKSAQSALTTHQLGRGWYYAGGRSSCTACHSSEGFVEMVATGKGIEDFETATANPSPPNCRTCHEIHTTYTEADFALRTTEPVELLIGGTYDQGDGNLCANCHQPRRNIVAEDGIVNVSSTHWGPHHGPQSAMLLGIGGALATGSPSVHYMVVEDGCPQCHLAEDNHMLTASEDSCQVCHAEADGFDIDGVQTEVEELIVELEGLLVDKGLLAVAPHEPWHEGPPEVHPVVGKYPEAEAGALWNYIMIQVEDGSKGVHNPAFTIDLLEASIAALQ
jgi:hypothetical protein